MPNMVDYGITRRGLMLASAGLALAPAALAQQSPPAANAPAEPKDEITAWIDTYGRPAASVTVNGFGPFKFLVDTGSTTTVIAMRRAAAMGLEASGVMMVNGTTGTAEVPMTVANQLQCGAMQRSNLRVAMLDRGSLAYWDGILGADMFMGRRLNFDIPRKTVTVSSGMRTPEMTPGVAYGIADRFTLRNGVLAEMTGRVGKVSAKLILDTGADSSIANLALSRALLARHPNQARLPNVTIIGITGEVMTGEGIALPPVRLGNVVATQTAAIAVEASIFRVCRLEDEPAMLVGIDLLSRLERFSIDYRLRTFQAKTVATLMSRGSSAFG